MKKKTKNTNTNSKTIVRQTKVFCVHLSLQSSVMLCSIFFFQLLWPIHGFILSPEDGLILPRNSNSIMGTFAFQSRKQFLTAEHTQDQSIQLSTKGLSNIIGCKYRHRQRRRRKSLTSLQFSQSSSDPSSSSQTPFKQNQNENRNWNRNPRGINATQSRKLEKYKDLYDKPIEKNKTKNNGKSSFPLHRSSKTRDLLIRVIDSIIYYYNKNDKKVNSNVNVKKNIQKNNNTGPSDTTDSSESTSFPKLVQALQLLKEARHPAHIHQIEQRFFPHTAQQTENPYEKNQQQQQQTTTNLLQDQPHAIQERLLKVLSLVGLTDQASALLSYMIRDSIKKMDLNKDEIELPNHKAYMPVLNAFRQEGRIQELRQHLDALTSVGRSHNTTIHISAFNVYLAALCETQDSSQLHVASEILLESLAEATKTPMYRSKCVLGAVSPDLTSFNTILHGAAKMGNTTVFDRVWNALQNSDDATVLSLQPDIRSYNARLQLEGPSISFPSTFAVEKKNSHNAMRLQVWDELKENVNVVPDRYTIDSMILPLLDERPEELENVLQDFVHQQQHSKGLLGDAFASFLYTLVQSNERSHLEYARSDIFHRYIIPQDETVTTVAQDMYRTNNTSLPTADQCHAAPWTQSRHFNILLDAYRKLSINAATMGESHAVSLMLIPNATENAGKTSNSIQTDNSTETQKNVQLTAKEKWAQEEIYWRQEGRALFRLMQKAGISPDAYTLTSMMGLCNTCQEISMLLNHGQHNTKLSAAVIRSAITASGKLGHPDYCIALFDKYGPKKGNVDSSSRLWNVLLGALADCAAQGNPQLQGISSVTSLFSDIEAFDKSTSGNSLLNDLEGKTCTEIVTEILFRMSINPRTTPTAQTYCVAAAALQYDQEVGPNMAIDLFRNATSKGVPADGRFVNALFRCFCGNINEAIDAWKNEIRPACLAYEARPRKSVNERRPTNKNLIAAYNGLLHVCGRAQRPDIGVRLVYAMKREDIEPNEVSLNNYRSGKRIRMRLEEEQNGLTTSGYSSSLSRAKRLLSLPQRGILKNYEDVLLVECTKYNQNNKRMSSDKRLRIIV